MSAPVDPFRAVHRASRLRTFGVTLVGALAVSLVVAATCVVPAAVAGPGAVVEAVPAAIVAAPVADAADPVPAPVVDTAAAPVAGASTLATPQAGALPTAAPVTPVAAEQAQHPMASSAPVAPAPAVSPAVRSIGIHASGYQAELDQCLWVRMDLAGSTAPIVGAHNNCGGDVVLDLQIGEVVELSGQELDGRYVMVGARDGYPGQDAGEATRGFGATVILQTCYFEGPNVRLVALVPLA